MDGANTLLQRCLKSLDACENSWLRRILRISYKDHITNETVRKRTGQEYVSNVIKRRRLKWAGHMMRMENTSAVKRSWKYQPQGKRSRGRPRTRWNDCLEQDLKDAGLSLYGKTLGRERMSIESIASDRGVWRKVIEASLTGDSRWKIGRAH